MKSILFFLSVYLLSHTPAASQVSQTIKIKADNHLSEKLNQEIYLYPNFKPGIIIFKKGTANRADFNYNMLFNEMEFVSPAGDTLSIANPETINFVNISKDTFFFNEGYLQLIAENNLAKLAIRQSINIDELQNIARNKSASKSSYYILLKDLEQLKLSLKRDLVLNKQVTFYIGDQNNNFLKAAKKNVMATFTEQQQQLDGFFKKNNINFNNLEDLVKLITFLKDPK